MPEGQACRKQQRGRKQAIEVLRKAPWKRKETTQDHWVEEPMGGNCGSSPSLLAGSESREYHSWHRSTIAAAATGGVRGRTGGDRGRAGGDRGRTSGDRDRTGD